MAVLVGIIIGLVLGTGLGMWILVFCTKPKIPRSLGNRGGIGLP
jgi:hypothetical protein